MADHEIFTNPVVKTVAFEVRFPNLFFIEARIGEFQVKVMKDFPQSELVLRRNFMVVSADNIQELAKQQQGDAVVKIWQFKSATGTKLEISSKSLVLSSENHLSYHQGGEGAFRGIIDRILVPFFAMVQIPVALRVGLRYVNECPVFDRTTATFNECYNSILPLNRFALEHVVNADCVVLANTGTCQIRHMESLQLTPAGDKLIIDLDAAAENVPSEHVMDSADNLHETVSDEFNTTIKGPVVDFMRRPKGDKR
jgi:uncharacterized protein (TIGR04255 family)